MNLHKSGERHCQIPLEKRDECVHLFERLANYGPTAESLLTEVQSLHRLVCCLGFIVKEESLLQHSQMPQFLVSIIGFKGGKALRTPEQI